MHSRGKMSLGNDEESIAKAFLQCSSFKSEIYKQTECYSVVFSKCLYHNTTTNCSSFVTATDEFILFAGCILPPTKACLVCDQELQKHNSLCV